MIGRMNVHNIPVNDLSGMNVTEEHESRYRGPYLNSEARSATKNGGNESEKSNDAQTKGV